MPITIDVGGEAADGAGDGDRATPGAQSADALLRAGLRRRHVEATLVRELGFSDEEARDVVAGVLAREAS